MFDRRYDNALHDHIVPTSDKVKQSRVLLLLVSCMLHSSLFARPLTLSTGARELVGDFVTNADGRLPNGPALKVGEAHVMMR